VVVGVSYGTDVNLALSTIDEILRANPRVLQDPAPGIGLARLADSSVNINVNPWVNVPDYIAAVSEINQAILETFRARKVVIPLPQREVRMLERVA
jgi:small conductance mechanosensitive channel